MDLPPRPRRCCGSSAGSLSPRFPTPVETVQFLVRRVPGFRSTTGTWSVWNNELVQEPRRSASSEPAIALVIVIAIGVPIGYAMGRWWRVQAFFTDIVTVGLALPAYIWALLGVMWFGFGFRAPVFVAVVSATPGLIVHVLQGSLAIPRELRDMSGGVRRAVPVAGASPHPALHVRSADRRPSPRDHRDVGMRRPGRVVREQRGRRVPRAVLVRRQQLQRTDGLGPRRPDRRHHDRPRRHRADRSLGASLARQHHELRLEPGERGSVNRDIDGITTEREVDTWRG